LIISKIWDVAHSVGLLKKKKKEKKKKKVKDLFGTCGLETLFFGTSILIRIADDTWVLKKYGYGTSVHFFIQNLTDCHPSNLRGWHVAQWKKKQKKKILKNW
jgi:hypothetical protein